MADRRSFLTGVGAAGAAVAAVKPASASEVPEPPAPRPVVPPAETARRIAAVEQSQIQFQAADEYHVRNAGSDYMVDVMMAPRLQVRGRDARARRSAGCRSRSSITPCRQDGVALGRARRHLRLDGPRLRQSLRQAAWRSWCTTPSACSTRRWAIFNAWADRVPMLVMLGNYADGALRFQRRRLGSHSMVDNAAMCRGYIKYDEQPGSLTALQRIDAARTRPHDDRADGPDHHRRASRRCKKTRIAQAPAADAAVCDAELSRLPIRTRSRRSRKLLVAAKNPVIVAIAPGARKPTSRISSRSPRRSQVPVIDKLGRMNFPTNHYLNGVRPAVIGSADLILALDLGRPLQLRWRASRIDRAHQRPHAASPDCKVISIDSRAARRRGQLSGQTTLLSGRSAGGAATPRRRCRT